jgi:hypothetical protein
MCGRARQYGWIGRRRYMGMVAARPMQLADPPAFTRWPVFPDDADQEPSVLMASHAIISFSSCSAYKEVKGGTAPGPRGVSLLLACSGILRTYKRYLRPPFPLTDPNEGGNFLQNTAFWRRFFARELPS